MNDRYETASLDSNFCGRCCPLSPVGEVNPSESPEIEHGNMYYDEVVVEEDPCPDFDVGDINDFADLYHEEDGPEVRTKRIRDGDRSNISVSSYQYPELNEHCKESVIETDFGEDTIEGLQKIWSKKWIYGEDEDGDDGVSVVSSCYWKIRPVVRVSHRRSFEPGTASEHSAAGATSDDDDSVVSGSYGPSATCSDAASMKTTSSAELSGSVN